MNRKQYSEIQHCLGVLEGLGTALRGTAADLFNNILKRLDRVINELAPTVDQPEAGQGGEFEPTAQTSREGASKPEEAKASWEEAKAAWEKMQKKWEKLQKEGVTVDAGDGTAIGNCSTSYDPDTPSTPTSPLG